MKKIRTLLKKELLYYLNNPIGYIAAILFAIFTNFLFIKDLFLRGNSSMRPFFDVIPWLLIIFIPAVSMRIFAEEKRINTLEILLTLSLAETVVVAAKFLALLFFVCISLILTISAPLTLNIISKIALVEVSIGYFGIFLLTSSFISTAMFFSSLTKNQIVAFLTSALAIFFLMVVGSDFFASVTPRLISDNISLLTPLYHYGNFIKGVIDLRSVFYFLSLTVLFIFLTIINLEKRD